MIQNKFLLYALRIILVFAAVLFGLVVLAWNIGTFPFKFIKKVFKKRQLDRFLRKNANTKYLFYTSSNNKMVEQYLLPLLDKSFTIHFIEQGDIDAWDGSPYLKEILEEGDLQGGYPYFVQLRGYSFDYLSFRKNLGRLKKGVITTTYAMSVIYFFFNGIENDVE
jgi:hypothetical protein